MQITIAEVTYEIEDILSNITIADSAVNRRHKIGSGNGERKIYLYGNADERLNFFDSFRADIQGFVWRQNLLEYLEMAGNEYKNPKHEYKDKQNMAKEYDELIRKVRSKEDDILKFKVKKADVTHLGLYINQNSGKKTDVNWNLIGDIALPRISRLSILKLSNNGIIRYYFKLSFGTVEMAELEEEREAAEIIDEINNSRLSDSEKERIIKARTGQGIYRKNLLKETSICPFTLVDDEHLLIASHIKPWSKSKNEERTDSKNGFVFTPTYDKLFDRGYISFSDEKKLIISPVLSNYNRRHLGLEEGMELKMLPDFGKKRKEYLEYHREHILKKLEDL